MFCLSWRASIGCTSVFVPVLQAVEGVLKFIRIHRGHPVASTAMVEPITRRFVASIEDYVRDHNIPMITFEKGQRKDDIAKQRHAAFDQQEGVVFVGKAQEKCTVYRTEKRRNPRTQRSYAWIVKSTALVNHYYFYCLDRNFGPFFLKFCSYLPHNAKLCLNGHEYAKHQLDNKGIEYQALDNGVPIRGGCNPSAMAFPGKRSMPYCANGCVCCPILFPPQIAKPDTAINCPSCKSSFP